MSAPTDPSRRRLLALAAVLGAAAAIGGAALGRTIRRVTRPDPDPIQEAMAHDLGAEYMELVARAYHPERCGDLQLLLAPFNSANYPQESRSLVPRDPRTSHASVWMYLERVRWSSYGAGRRSRRLRRARLARRRRADDRRADRVRRLPRSRPRGSARCPASRDRRTARRSSSRS